MLRLKEVFKEKGVTGKELAEKLGITENALSLIANGKRQPRFELLKDIARVLNVDIRELFEPTKEDTTEYSFKCPYCGKGLDVVPKG